MQFNISKTIEENKNLIDTKFIYNKTFKRFEQKVSDSWIINNDVIKKIILEPTGFSVINGETDIYSSVINFAKDTRILSITPTNEHFIFYINGKEYIKTDISQVQISDIEGLHYIYFNNNGVLESKNDFLISEITRKYASVATIYWDAINKKATYIGDKRHSINTDAYQNYLNFINDKTVDYLEGTNIKFTNNKDGGVNNKVDGDGTSNYHTSFAIEAGKYKNYELIHDSEHIEFNENIPILYKETVSQEKNWVAMATSSSKMVAIANDGECRVMYSADNGETWQKVLLPFYSIWTDIVYGQNKFVAIASSGDYSVMISSDGLNWTPIAVPQKNSWQSLVYSSQLDIFAAVSLDGVNRIMTSTNGSLWIMRTTPNYLPLKAITYSPTNGVNVGKFITVSEDDIFNLNDPNDPSIIGYSKAFTSADGITWTNLNISQSKTWKTINYGNGIFIALANSGKHRVLNATTGNIWSAYEMTNSTIDGYVWTSLIYAFGYHMAVSSDGKFARSLNGLNWETTWTINSVANTVISNNSWQKIANNSSTLVAITNAGTNRITYSANSGFTWTNTTSQDTKVLEDIVYGSDRWIAVSSATSNSGYRITNSTTLATWTDYTTGYDNTIGWKSIAYGNLTYVAVGVNGGANRIIYSTNGTSWSVSANIPSSKNFTKVKYLQNGFYALTEDNLIYYSVTGISGWYKVNFSAEIVSASLTIVDFSASFGSLSFLTNTNKIITTSITFTSSSSTEGSFSNNKLLNVIDNLFFTGIGNDAGGDFVISTRQNKTMVSSDNGVTWTIRDIADSKMYKVKYISQLPAFFLIGNSGANRIIYSTDLFNSVQKNITTSVFNHSITDFLFFNNNYYFLLNSGNFRIIKSSQVTYTSQESEISSFLNLKDAIKDVYNSWRKIEDTTDTEAVKNRCLIFNNKINYNRYLNGFYTLQNCDDEKFYLYHIFMTNDKDNKYFIISGNYEYITKEEAKNSILEEINKLSGLPFNDFLPLGTIIYEVNANYANSAKARIVNINGNNYHKLVKKDLISINSFSNINNLASTTIKKENNLLNNSDLINLYGNKILEYALNKLQSLSSRDIDSFITRQEIVLLSGATTDISAIFGSQITGSYEIFDKNNPEIGCVLFLKQNATGDNPNQNPDVNITSYTSLILPSKTSNTGLLGVYIENNYLLSFKNFSSETINLVIYRKI